MAAAYTALTRAFNMMHIMPVLVTWTTTTTGDWTTLTGFKGVIPLAGFAVSTAANNADAFTYATVTINNGGTAYGATDTSIVIQSGAVTRSSNPYFILTGGGEIIEVTTDSAPTSAASTLTIRRGCFGTTATGTGLANTNVCTVLNMVISTCSSVGTNAFMLVLPFPDDSYEKLMVAATR